MLLKYTISCITSHTFHRIDMLVKCKLIMINVARPEFELFNQEIINSCSYKKALKFFLENGGSLKKISKKVSFAPGRRTSWHLIPRMQRKTLLYVHATYPHMNILDYDLLDKMDKLYLRKLDGRLTSIHSHRLHEENPNTSIHDDKQVSNKYDDMITLDELLENLEKLEYTVYEE